MSWDSVDSAQTTLNVDLGAIPSPGATGSYQLVGRVKKIKLSGFKADAKETTSLIEVVKTFRAGKIDSGDMEFSIFFKADDYNTLLGLFNTRQNYNFQLQFPDGPDFENPIQDGSDFIMECVITDIPLDVPEDDEIMCDGIKLKISGPVTFNASSA